MNDPQRERTSDEPAAGAGGSPDQVGYAEPPSGANVGGNVSSVDSAGDLPQAITVTVVGRTDVGLVREHNEDNFLLADLGTGSRDPDNFREISRSGLLLAVCDGMGGAAAGEVASQMAVDTLYEMMRRGGPPADRDGLARNLVRSVEEAGARIFESARADRSKRGMGTTATVAALMDKTLFVGQVGDSRAYVLRTGELKQITKDQSLVNQLIEAGQLTEDEAEAFEHSNIILQALGTTEQVSVDLTFLELRQGDRLLMCSDGLSGLVHGDVIREVLAEFDELDACCERLIELAKAGGGHDNITVILAEFGGSGLADPQPSDLAGYQQYPLPLDATSRVIAPLHSDMPTLAPPATSVPADEGPELVREPRLSLTPRGGTAGRLLVFAILIAGAAAALYFWMAERERRARRLVVEHEAEVAVAPEPVIARVDVVVQTDVENGELLVDGRSQGTASTDAGWTLELVPGLHQLQARVGGEAGSIIASSTLTVQENTPASVFLSLPAGSSFGEDAGVVAATPVQPAARARVRASREDAAARRRHRRERGSERVDVYVPPAQDVPARQPVTTKPAGLTPPAAAAQGAGSAGAPVKRDH
jgi:serine/threonine protein phosphatase PrpC